MATNLVQNGGFEQPVVTNPRMWDYFAAVPGWQTTDVNAKPFEIWRDPTVIGTRPPCFSVERKQNLEILAHAPTKSPFATTVWQTVKTSKGRFYAFSFYYTPRPGHKSSLTVAINNTKLCTFDVDGTALSGFNWMQFSVNFISAKNGTKLSFTDTRHPAGGAGTHIDDVVLKQIPPQPHLQKF